MWIAQWPDGVWCSYREKPQVKMGGWSGEVHAVLSFHNHIISWRETLKEVSEQKYREHYVKREVK